MCWVAPIGVIGFCSWLPGADDIYIMNLDGSELQRLTEYPDHAGYLAYSPDGSLIAHYADHGDRSEQPHTGFQGYPPVPRPLFQPDR